ncbi:hypothetical protein [Streptomyces sp. NPDC056192]|uniref:hypothetical protein n=1 Tax=unclassified Streptomyces TaxID=2593676 RepID=UPI0035D7EE40
MAHNGNPVRVPDVITPAMPWLTSNADDPEPTGQFGIGLMTLRRRSPVLEVYCCDYRIRIGAPRPCRIPT